MVTLLQSWVFNFCLVSWFFYMKIIFYFSSIGKTFLLARKILVKSFSPENWIYATDDKRESLNTRDNVLIYSQRLSTFVPFTLVSLTSYSTFVAQTRWNRAAENMKASTKKLILMFPRFFHRLHEINLLKDIRSKRKYDRAIYMRSRSLRLAIFCYSLWGVADISKSRTDEEFFFVVHSVQISMRSWFTDVFLLGRLEEHRSDSIFVFVDQ